MALKSGLLAARSVAEATASKRDLAEIYRLQFESLLNVLKELSSQDKKVTEEAEKGPKALLTAFADGLRATLQVS